MTAYSIDRVRRGLIHFGVGKLGSGLVGIALMLMLVRVMSAPAYASMVTLIAAFEVLSLVLNMGAMPITWRFLPHARSVGTAADVSRLVSLIGIWRTLPLILAGGVIAWQPELLQSFAAVTVAEADTVAKAFAVILVAETLCRHCDLVMELMLLQRVSQFLILARATARLLGLLYLTNLGLLTLGLEEWLLLEVTVAAVGLLAGLISLFVLVYRPARGCAPSGVMPTWSRAVRFALPSYVAQVLGSVQGLDACKLVLGHLASPQTTAAFGFIASLVSTFQRYLPSYLLLGFVRPLFVHADLRESRSGACVDMAGVLLKINLVILLPVLAIATSSSDSIVAALSGGHVEVDPWVLTAALVLLAFQAIHMTLGLLALSVEESVSGMIGTATGAALFVVGSYVLKLHSPESLLLLAILCEFVWCSVVQSKLRRRDRALRSRDIGYSKLAIATLATAGCGNFFLSLAEAIDGRLQLWILTSVVGVLFIGFMVISKPLHPNERSLLAKLIPSRLILI